MGCDIHAYVATVSKTDRHGDLIGLDGEPRDYALFGYLAGVRGAGAPVVQPRGIPDWWGRLTEYLYFMEPKMGWDLGDHSYTWLTADELEQALVLAEKQTGWARHYWHGVLALMRGIALENEGEYDVFLVLGFDN